MPEVPAFFSITKGYIASLATPPCLGGPTLPGASLVPAFAAALALDIEGIVRSPN